MVVATIRIKTNPETRKELMQTLQLLSNPIKSERGCRSCRVYRELGDEEAVILIQEWDSKVHWDNHMRSEDFAVMMGAMSLLDESEKVELQLLNPVEGVNCLQAVRNRTLRVLR